MFQAWAHAVKYGCTVIVFDSGNALRIGIRHRGRKTLYISPCIDVHTCEDPVYGKLMVSIHLAIINDALKRVPFVSTRSNDTPGAMSIKRRHEAEARLRNKYTIYSRLRSASCGGIPHVFGYFEDVETSASILVLSTKANL